MSRLTEPTHVSLIDYGKIGEAYQNIKDEDGNDALQSTFKRHIGENMVDALTGFYDVVYYTHFEIDRENTDYFYISDFDDPASPGSKGITGQGAVDREVVTASGDSGGPLMIDQKYQTLVIAGVLCCDPGYRNTGYEDFSMHTPLFIYANWLAENNPYKYVEWKGGDGEWADKTVWRQFLDPGFLYEDKTRQLKNGIPEKDMTGTSAASFGNINSLHSDRVKNVDQTSPSIVYLTDKTISENFIPNNDYGNEDTSQRSLAKFYEVWLNQEGKVSLSGDVEIDRLKLRNPKASLNIRSDGNMLVNIDIYRLTGRTTSY